MTVLLQPTGLRAWLRPVLWLVLLAAAVLPAQAQISVSLQLKRRMYLAYEPLLATVVIGNNTGRDIMMADTAEGGPWFSFQITSTDGGRIVSPRSGRYELEPLEIKAGETVKRTVNLNELYELGDFGTYHVKASVYYTEAGKYFASKLNQFVLTEGRKIWSQTVGNPNGGNRLFQLLTMEHDRTKMLYVRVQDPEGGTVFGCYNLGRLVEGISPDVKFDGSNNLAVLQLIGQKTYLLSRIGVDGNFIGQNTYVTPKTQPYLRKTDGGALQIVGAVRQDTVVKLQEEALTPKLSDRPPGF